MTNQSVKSKKSSHVIELNLGTVDLGAIQAAIESSGSLDDNDAIFQGLSEIQFIKDKLAEASALVKATEDEVKSTINSKAKALIGKNWQVVKGEGYKISRSEAGAKYEATEDADDKYLKVAISVNSDEVDDFVKNSGKLPKGIAYNPKRSEQIRITVKH